MKHKTQVRLEFKFEVEADSPHEAAEIAATQDFAKMVEKGNFEPEGYVYVLTDDMKYTYDDEPEPNLCFEEKLD